MAMIYAEVFRVVVSGKTAYLADTSLFGVHSLVVFNSYSITSFVMSITFAIFTLFTWLTIGMYIKVAESTLYAAGAACKHVLGICYG
jgi:hypothetical protein